MKYLAKIVILIVIAIAIYLVFPDDSNKADQISHSRSESQDSDQDFNQPEPFEVSHERAQNVNLKLIENQTENQVIDQTSADSASDYSENDKFSEQGDIEPFEAEPVEVVAVDEPLQQAELDSQIAYDPDDALVLLDEVEAEDSHQDQEEGIETEEVDQSWAAEIEDRIATIFTDSDNYVILSEGGLDYSAAECRTSLCKIDFIPNREIDKTTKMKQALSLTSFLGQDAVLASAQMNTQYTNEGFLTVTLRFKR